MSLPASCKVGFVTAVVWALHAVQALNPVVIKGYKFFDSVTGYEIVFRGIDYYPRPNQGPLNQNSIDYFTEEHRLIWERDIVHLQALGVNAIRLYSVDPYQNHDAFMCAMNAAGIYVVVELASACPICAITRDETPDCYPPELKTRGQAIIKDFGRFPNTLAFSTGNEVNHFAPPGQPQWNAPCQKKFLRDMRAFLYECSNEMRRIPVGLVSADSDREANTLYYNCQSSGEGQDDLEPAEWYGLNSYVFCDGGVNRYEDALGFVALQQSFDRMNYSIPVLLTEFGCLSDTFPTEDGYEGQRDFRQANWLWTEPVVRDQFEGGFVFEYSIEMQNAKGESPYPFTHFGKQNYGIGYFSPEDCNDIDIPCVYNRLPAFSHLKAAYDIANEVVSNSSLTIDSFVVPKRRRNRTTCPDGFPAIKSFSWNADSTKNLKCLSAQASNFTCPANLDDLRPRVHPKHIPKVWLSLATCVLVVALVVMIVITRRKRRQRDTDSSKLPWTIMIPNDSEFPELDESDESTGLLSMHGVRRSGGDSPYHAIESDASSDDLSGEGES